MARHGLFHDALGEAHETNKTPHIAVALSALITFLLPASVYFSGINTFDAQGYFGTLCSFGFLLVYILVSIAAPMYLRALGKLRKTDVLFAVLGCAFMLLPLVGTIGIPGSALFPPPAFPSNLLVWIFVAYMVVGLVGLLIQRARSPKMLPTMKHSLDEIELKFNDAKDIS
jgi:amino acid transporter